MVGYKVEIEWYQQQVLVNTDRLWYRDYLISQMRITQNETST